MKPGAIRVIRKPERLIPDPRRVITRYFDLGHPMRDTLLERVMKIPEKDVSRLLEKVIKNYARRHRNIEEVFMRNYKEIIRIVNNSDKELKVSGKRKLLIGAYYTQEYSVEAAALFNPSIVLHPDQSGLKSGAIRFIMSLRATGEGHISSIAFVRGIVSASGEIEFDPPPRYCYSARPIREEPLDKKIFKQKLLEMGNTKKAVEKELSRLLDAFKYDDILKRLRRKRETYERREFGKSVTHDLLWLARANYSLKFPKDCRPSEIIIFPGTAYERHGMEDLRLTRFVDDDGQVRYLGTYTAYDGRHIHPMLLETSDFINFHIRTLTGKCIRNKGIAFFPRKINGRYYVVSRHDGENLYLLNSDNYYLWNNSKTLQVPAEPWELVKIGNCGSPLETEAGWLLITHGVGPVRQYCIGATLLDVENPARIIGRLKEPLLIPSGKDREGYVPNVMYSCGSIIHNGQLIIPYGISDSRAAFAMIPVKELLKQLLRNRPA